MNLATILTTREYSLNVGYYGSHGWNSNLTGQLSNSSDPNSHRYTQNEAVRLALSERMGNLFFNQFSIFK